MDRDERSDGQGPERGTNEDPKPETVARVSPEGTPADPSVGLKKFGKLWLGLALAVILLGVLLGFLWQPVAGVVVGIVGLVSLIVNPEVLAGLLRTQDRAKAKRQER